MDPDKKYIGYARVSTADQDLALQVAALVKFGIPENHIIKEHASGGTMDRPEWNKIMAASHRGHVIVVWKLDRLGRTLTGVISAADELRQRGIELVSLTESLDTTSAMGRFFFSIIASMAELERGLISERTKAGIAVKRAQGVRFGAPHSIKDNPLRLQAYLDLEETGLDRTASARDIMDLFNKADPNARPIGHPNTVRNWRRDGCPGLSAFKYAKLDDET